MKSAPLTAAVRPRPVESADLLRGHRREGRPTVTLATLSRGLGVAALSGCAVVAFAIARGPETPVTPPTAVAPPPAPRAAVAVPDPAPAAQDVRLVYGNPDAPRGYDRPTPPSEPAPQMQAIVAPPVAAPPPAAALPPAEPARAADPPFLVAAVDPAPLPDAARPLVEVPAAAGEGIDLNTASVEQLNRLDGGMIGRAIVRGRPYASPKELVERRILSRASFEKIKGRVLVGAAR